MLNFIKNVGIFGFGVLTGVGLITYLFINAENCKEDMSEQDL